MRDRGWRDKGGQGEPPGGSGRGWGEESPQPARGAPRATERDRVWFPELVGGQAETETPTETGVACQTKDVTARGQNTTGHHGHWEPGGPEARRGAGDSGRTKGKVARMVNAPCRVIGVGSVAQILEQAVLAQPS